MKSNYPRASDHPHVEAKPRVLAYSVGLGLVSFLVIAVVMAINSLASSTYANVTGVTYLVIVVSAIVVLSFGVILLWKCSRWPLRDKAKLITVSTGGCWVLMCAISLAINSPRPSLVDVAPLFFPALFMYFAAMAGAATVVWILAAGVRWLEGRPKATGAGAIVVDVHEELAPAAVNAIVEPEVVRTNA